jgi:DeoR/GlpR family transcriptional regulator of sugar metabolism
MLDRLKKHDIVLMKHTHLRLPERAKKPDSSSLKSDLMPRTSAADSRKDRDGQILQEVLRSTFVSTADLARQFGVSTVAIRRNLADLEQGGLVKRVHGGVQAVTRPGQVAQYNARLLESVATKRAIGQAAAGLIRPGDTLMLDSGTTVLEVARAIPASLLENSNLTVVTRSLVIAGELRLQRQVRLMVLGGIYVHDLDDFVGAQVEYGLQGLHVNMCFIGTDGLSVERGITTDNVLEAQLYRLIACVADQVVVVADSSKIGNQKLQTILPFDEINTLVTDTCAPTNFVQALRDKGVNVVLAPAPARESCK